MSISSQQYINISSNIIAGYNEGLETSITLTTTSTGSAIIGLNYSTTNLGYEILPNPIDSGVIRYRYAPDSTVDLLGYGGEGMYVNVNRITANTETIINPDNNIAGINIFIDDTSKGGVIAVNANSGISRIQMAVDQNQQGLIQFYENDFGTKGTLINNSTVTSEYIIGSTVEATTGLLLHPANDLSISSLLNMNMDGNLYWNGIQINNGGSGPPVPPATDYLYTSTLEATSLFLTGNNTLNQGILRADSSLTLLWNNQPLQIGATQDIFNNTTYTYAQISNVSSLKVTVSSFQGIYNEPSLPAQWLISGTNFGSSPIYNSLDNETFNPPTTNGSFNNSGNSIYGNIYTGQIIAVGNDDSNTFKTVQLSNDAKNWNYIYTNNPFSQTANTVYFANNLWLIGGSTLGTNIPPIIWSNDGINFYRPQIYPSDAGKSANSFSYNGELFVAAMDRGFDVSTSLLWSSDGLNWNRIVSGGFTTEATAVANNNYIWVACGKGQSNSLNRIQWSTDALNWNNAFSIPTNFQFGNTVSYANGLWHIGGIGLNNITTLLWSSDGKNWYPQVSGNITEVYDIKYIENRWYAGGTNNQNNGLLKSVDGYNWSSFYPSTFYQQDIKSIYFLENVLKGTGSITTGPSTTMYITAAISSYALNTTKGTISTLNASNIISPNFVQLQNITF